MKDLIDHVTVWLMMPYQVETIPIITEAVIGWYGYTKEFKKEKEVIL